MTTNCKLLSSWHYINVRSDIEYETQSSRAQESCPVVSAARPPPPELPAPPPRPDESGSHGSSATEAR